MSVVELYKGDTHEGNIVQDATRKTLGARGIDMIVAERTWGPSGDPLLYQKRKQYPLYDGHGNMFASIIRGTGNSYQLVNERRYDAWGATGVVSGPGDALANPKEGYCGSIGHKLDPESGLIYMRARYYEPGTGRFISQDPALHGANWYVYCSNDPVIRTDPTGTTDFLEIWHLFHSAPEWFYQGLRASWEAGPDAFGDFLTENWKTSTMLFSVGTAWRGGGSLSARLAIRMLILESRLAEFSLEIDMYGVIEADIDAIPGLIRAAQTARMMGE